MLLRLPSLNIVEIAQPKYSSCKASTEARSNLPTYKTKRNPAGADQVMEEFHPLQSSSSIHMFIVRTKCSLFAQIKFGEQSCCQEGQEQSHRRKRVRLLNLCRCIHGSCEKFQQVAAGERSFHSVFTSGKGNRAHPPFSNLLNKPLTN